MHSTAMTIDSGKYRNLQELQTIYMSSARENDDGTDVSIPDWGELARILSHVRQKVEVKFDDNDSWEKEEMQALTRAISHGQPAITSFDTCFDFPYESLDALYSALATLPTLESVWIGTSEPLQETVSALANPESMTDLLQAPSLRSVCFHHFRFTRALCQATANTLGEGTVITRLEFKERSFLLENVLLSWRMVLAEIYH
jgi:hypothetical protein